jgi:hypothetical protein
MRGSNGRSEETATTDYGTLNGQPVGPSLPKPVPCERCDHPVYLGWGLIAYTQQGERRSVGYVVLEQSLAPPPDGMPWRLEPHRCRPAQSWDPVANLHAARVL